LSVGPGVPKDTVMGRFGSFVPRLIALTIIWLLATAALTFAAAQKIATVRPPATTTTQAAAPQRAVLVVPDVRRQAFVFAKGTLSDAGFSFRVEGSVHGYASNSVVAQSPAAGTHVFDTGAPMIVLHLSRSGAQSGLPEDTSAVPGTRIELADLALNRVTAPVAMKKAVVKKVAVKKAAVEKAAVKKAVPKKAAPKKVAPKHRWPQHRPPAFVVAGARREPLNEMPLTVRAQVLLTWMNGGPKPTDANVHRWLFQHAWIVTGAQLGWWHGAAALKTLEAVDQRAWAVWGIGARSHAVARQALAQVEAKSS
jgi:PASTA domain